MRSEIKYKKVMRPAVGRYLLIFEDALPDKLLSALEKIETAHVHKTDGKLMSVGFSSEKLLTDAEKLVFGYSEEKVNKARGKKADA